ncbi:MAG: chorismate synthase, partial [Victivallaceae bacterium]|nr:chorismate synthase [Victivallaceae bacterium]
VRDYRGGGRSSARETAVRVAAGAIAKLLLKQVGVEIRACAFEIGGVAASRIDWDEVEKNPVRSPDAAAAAAMREAIEHARSGRDSVGGIVLCEAVGVPAGWGDPIFGKIDARLAGAMMSLGAARGFEVGDGFAVAKSHGSENNDAMVPGGGFATNHAGGILGGMSNGNTIVFRVAFKPTPSIAAPQKTVDVDGEAVELEIKGRHDPCVVPRAVPVVEAMTALVLADLMLTNRSSRV